MHSGLYTSIPQEFISAYNLNWRDEFQWQAEEDGIKLKFVQGEMNRLETTETEPAS